MGIEKALLPQVNILQTENKSASAKILDAELDVLNCSFNNDLCVEIDTKEYSSITLTVGNLQVLKSLITKAEQYYKDAL